jgi:hypothetical protein
MLHALVSTMVKSMGDDRGDCQTGRGTVDISEFLKSMRQINFIF